MLEEGENNAQRAGGGIIIPPFPPLSLLLSFFIFHLPTTFAFAFLSLLNIYSPSAHHHYQSTSLPIQQSRQLDSANHFSKSTTKCSSLRFTTTATEHRISHLTPPHLITLNAKAIALMVQLEQKLTLLCSSHMSLHQSSTAKPPS